MVIPAGLFEDSEEHYFGRGLFNNEAPGDVLSAEIDAEAGRFRDAVTVTLVSPDGSRVKMDLIEALEALNL